ncbi:MAG: hypothetical protein H7257_05820 [Taibaiella sp.]|nr:hypothetical protein [Taibaiella sp.]
MEDKIKKCLFFLLLTVLWFPRLQDITNLFHSKDLKGAYVLASDVEFSWGKWWAGGFAPAKDSFLADHFGFRSDFIRLNNQFDLMLFHKLHYNSSVYGKERCLFDDRYINAYTGRDCIGYGAMRERLLMVKAISDTLGRLGKSLVFIHAPCKASFYPECIPDYYLKDGLRITNYQLCKRIGDSLGIVRLDMDSYLRFLKSKDAHLLYTRQGSHWSVYGAARVADTFARVLERLTHKSLPHIAIASVEYDDKPRYTDGDLAEPLNLIRRFSKEVYSYASLSYTRTADTNKPKVLYIGDSFLFQWMHLGILDEIGPGWQFWYYFKEVDDQAHVHDHGPGITNKTIDEIDWVRELESSDCITLIYSAHNLTNIGSGFVEKAFDHYYPKTPKR